MEDLLDLKQAIVLLTQKENVILCMISEEERKMLQPHIPVPLTEASHLSCQHLVFMEQKLAGNTPICLCVDVDTNKEVSAEDRALIYAMLVRCRKVISCRDKLEDMLKHQDETNWEKAKQVTEGRVMDLFKQTWRQVDSYPYVIVDDIKAYNKGEGYIMKALHQHLSERTPGIKNDKDAAMIFLLNQMFETISLSLIKPDVILLGKNAAEVQMNHTKIYRLNIL